MGPTELLHCPLRQHKYTKAPHTLVSDWVAAVNLMVALFFSQIIPSQFSSNYYPQNRT